MKMEARKTARSLRVIITLLFLLGAALVLCVGARADSGWVNDGGWYYYGADGVMRTGWIKPGSVWYYLDEKGLMQTGWLTIEGDGTYYLSASGAMRTGWLLLGDEWYYFNSSGRMQTGWIKPGSVWYYLDETGVMQTGWLTIEGDGTYYLSASGAMQTGWLKFGDDWRYFASGGRMQTGWTKVGDSWYYMDADGVMQTGYIELEDGLYYLLPSGRMYTGWLSEGGDWYYFTAAGRRALGWQWIDNDRYYFYQPDDGCNGKLAAMAVDTEIDGEIIKPDGTWLSDSEVNMVAKAQNYTSQTDYLILVDDDACKMGVFERTDDAWMLTYFWNCSPGASSSATVHGIFTVNLKGYYFISYGSRCYYYTQFCGNYLFHSVPYDPYTGALQDGRLGMHLSHGCVRLSLSNAKWVYDNIPKNTKVVVY